MRKRAAAAIVQRAKSPGTATATVSQCAEIDPVAENAFALREVAKNVINSQGSQSNEQVVSRPGLAEQLEETGLGGDGRRSTARLRMPIFVDVVSSELPPSRRAVCPCG